MRFALHKTKKDCTIPASALAVAGMKREAELRLEVDSGVIVVLRPQMSAKKMLAVSKFLAKLASGMIAAVAVESGECSCCGDCFGDDECDYCGSRDKCRGIEIPDCLLDSGSRFPDSVPEIARAAFNEADICVSRRDYAL